MNKVNWINFWIHFASNASPPPQNTNNVLNLGIAQCLFKSKINKKILFFNIYVELNMEKNKQYSDGKDNWIVIFFFLNKNLLASNVTFCFCQSFYLKYCLQKYIFICPKLQYMKLKEILDLEKTKQKQNTNFWRYIISETDAKYQPLKEWTYTDCRVPSIISNWGIYLYYCHWLADEDYKQIYFPLFVLIPTEESLLFKKSNSFDSFW